VRDLLYRATDGGRAASAVTDITSTHISRARSATCRGERDDAPAAIPASNQSPNQGGGDHGIRTSTRRDGTPSRPRY
jgi:hypothetical protein